MPTIQEVKTRHEARLLALPGVVSVGVGHGAADEPVIVVGLDRERPQTRAQIPARIEGYPVRAEVIGMPRAQ